MAIFLVQHGKSLSKDIDPEKGLSEEGISETERIATVAKGYDVHVSRIRHSGKKRARQTAEIFSAALEPENGIQQSSGMGPLDDVVAFADTITSEDDIMFVGHLPFMEKLASYLITGMADRPVFKCQNSGILCLDKSPGTQSWVIKWSLMPNIG
ncbi:phosphohistidine phosphatase SixA [Desulfonema magnum]|uniref:Phosphohistidine phosphatase n=1 Tax=Desulfonema magnum TaxID=45655 RepID=A0A975BTG5_9BACT|nr:phosphohistidine phosphatase SixA [Desulfonema magnum]QTA91128.1 Phosphohistidine phosphatase [Desulfonema magnum]